MPRHVCAGRLIGAAGAVCSTVFWCAMLYVVATILIEPSNPALGLRVAMPMAVFASVLVVIAAADVITLARRADLALPWRVASTHTVMALVVLGIGRFTADIDLFVRPTSDNIDRCGAPSGASGQPGVYRFRSITEKQQQRNG